MKKLYVFLSFILFAFGVNAQTFTTFAGTAPTSTGPHPGILETVTPTYREFRLTTNAPIEQKAAVWHDGALSLTGNWTRKAALNFGPYDETNQDASKPNPTYRTGADGIGMVLAPAKYLGEWGEEVGYGTRDVLAGTYVANNSLAFEMDTWKNETVGFNGSEGYLDHLERDGNHVAFMSKGNTIHNAGAFPAVGVLRTLTFDLETAGWIDVELSWTDNPAAGQGGTLSVVSPSHPNLNSSIVLSEAQITSYFGSVNPTLFMGFSAATGSAGNDHRVRWVLNPPPPPADCGQLRTQTQGGWGQDCKDDSKNNPGCYRDANFATAFPMGVRIGSTAPGCRSLLFTTSAAVEAFLPSGGPSKGLAQLGLPAGQTINPAGTSPATGRSNINGQLLALSVSVGFDNAIPSFGPAGVNLKDMIIGSGAFAGQTVGAFLAYANTYIGCNGTDAQIISDIQSTATSINENYVDGKVDNGFLDCPTAPKMRPTSTTALAAALTASVYPNPSRGQLNVNLSKIPAGSEIQVINSRGAIVARRAAGGAQNLMFDVSQYGAGVYLVKIISGSNVQTLKAIVQQ